MTDQDEIDSLRQQVADLTAERDEAQRQLDIVSHQAVQIRDEREFRIRERNRAEGRAEAAERALAARDEVIARVRALADDWEQAYPGSLAACNREPDEWWVDLRAALDGPASQPDEEPCPWIDRPECEDECMCLPAPPTTDAEEATES